MSVQANSGYATCPIESVNDNDCGYGVKGNVDKSSLGIMGSPYAPTLYQNDIWTGCQMKLRYEGEKKRLELEGQDVSYQKRLKFEEELKALNIHYQNYLKMLSATVYKDSTGDIIF